MAELDLRALSAPLEDLQPQIKAAYIRLDAKWDEITKTLRKLSVPSKISYVYSTHENSEDHCALEFLKWNGERRLCDTFYSYDHNFDGFRESVTPYEEWSAETRIALLKYVPALFKEAVKVTKEFIKKIPE